MRVLYVEDSASDADLARREFEHLAPEIELDVATTIAEAWERLKARPLPWRVLLTDMRLPDGNGLELLARVRAEALPIAVVVVTGSGDEGSAVAALKAGAEDYVVKARDHLQRLPVVINEAWLRHQSESTRRARPLKVLYAEHDPYDADLTRRFLAENAPHIRLEIVPTADDVFERFKGAGGYAQVCDVLVLDYRLPGLNAIEALKELREVRRVDVPIVIVTGRGSEELALQALRLGAAEFLPKQEGYLHQLPSIIEHAATRAELERERRALRDSRQQYADLIHAIDGIVWEGEADTFRFTFVSLQAERLLGYPVSAWLEDAQFWVGHIHPEDRERVVGYCRQCTDERRNHATDYRMIAADGRMVWLRDVVAVVVEPDRPVRRRGITIDITKSRAAEDKIRKLASFPELNPNPVLEFDATGALVYTNPASKVMARRVGVDDLESLLPPGAPGIVRDCLARGEPQLRIETRHGSHTLSWSFYPIVPGGTVHCYAGDITERLQLEEHLRQSQKMDAIGHLAGGVAHDFNNLLTVIQGNTSLMYDERFTAKERKEALDTIALACERAASLTRQLLAFSRRQVVQKRRLQLNEVVASMAKMLRRVLGEDVQLKLNLNARPLWTWADAGMLDQVLMNLVVNARDAMPNGGRLTIETDEQAITEADCRIEPEARPGAYLCLRVSDTGCGIPQENLERIFEPFFTTKELGKGTGLGLATVFGIVRQHSGFVRVSSEVGTGTAFTVFLPSAPEGPDAKAEVSPALPGGSETVLIVEDEAPVRRLVQRLLESRGYTVLVVANGDEAVACWERYGGTVDLLLTDIIMPGAITGRQLAESFQRQKPGLRVIYMSGYAGEVAARGLTLREGVNFLQKPFTLGALLECVRASLDGVAAPAEASGQLAAGPM